MLETEIKRLNENIQQLNNLLESMSDVAKSNVQEPAQESTSKADTPAAETKADTATAETDAYTTDTIKSMALAISRKDRSKQKDIKAKLAEHNAKVATDLSGDALQAVGEWLEALKTELGA